MMINRLEELMQNELDAVTGMDHMEESFEDAIERLKKILTKEEYRYIEGYILHGYCDAENFGFTQGFLRGIAVTKGGAI